MKAAGRTFAWIVVGPWVAFGGAFLLAVPRRAEEAALVFLVWVLAGLLYDLSLVRHSQAWLRAGLRRRVSEGTGAVAGTPPSTAAARGAR